jgi:hypothetical protein
VTRYFICATVISKRAVVTLGSWIWNAQTVNYCGQIRSVFEIFFYHLILPSPRPSAVISHLF